MGTTAFSAGASMAWTAKIPVTEADSESVGTTSTALVEERSGNAFMRNVIFGNGLLHNQSLAFWLRSDVSAAFLESDILCTVFEPFRCPSTSTALTAVRWYIALAHARVVGCSRLCQVPSS